MALSIKGKICCKTRFLATLFSALLFALLLTPLTAFADSYDSVEMDSLKQSYISLESSEDGSTQLSSEEYPPPETNSDVYDSSIENESDNASLTKADIETDLTTYDVRLPLEESTAIVLTPSDEKIAFAVYDATAVDENGNSAPSLTFHKQAIVPTPGTSFVGSDGVTRYVTYRYDGIEDIQYYFDASGKHQVWPGWSGTVIKQVVTAKVVDTISPISTSLWFWEGFNLKSADVKKLDTSRVTDMRSMFQQCYVLTDVDMSSFDTTNVMNFAAFFYNCPSLREVDISNFVINPAAAPISFTLCTSLETVYVNDTWPEAWFSPANTYNVYDSCPKLKQIVSPDNRPIAFAVYDDTTKTLTFHKQNVVPIAGHYFNKDGVYDEYQQGARYVSKVYAGFENRTFYWNGSNTSNWAPWSLDSVNKNVTIQHVLVVDEGISLGSCDIFFMSMTSLLDADIRKFDTSNATGMGAMFQQCTSLQSVLMDGLDTSEVTSTVNMFNSCASLQSIDLSNLNMSNVTEMTYMFYGCSSLQSLNFVNFKTANVTKIYGMFDGCASLTSLDISADTFTLENVTDTSYMFNACSKLETIKVNSTWNELWFMTHVYSGMYNGCIALKQFISTIPIAFAVFDSTNGAFTFHKSLYNNKYNGYLIPAAPVVSSEFRDSEGTPRNVTRVYTGFETAPYSNYQIDLLYPQWANDNTNSLIQTVKFVDTISPISTANWFYNCSSLVSIDLAKLNTSNVTTMGSMFQNCESLTALDLQTFDTHKVSDMSMMFASCKRLTSLDLSNFDTSKVTSMWSMFYSCEDLTSLNLRSFDTRSCHSFYAMFDGDKKLKVIYANNWDVSHANPNSDDEYVMFLQCTSLVGGMGSQYSYYCSSNPYYGYLAFAHVDGGSANPGFFTLAVDTSDLVIGNIDIQAWSPNGTELDEDSLVIFDEDGITPLKRGTDYEVSFSNNAIPGKGTVTIIGLGRYMGSTTCEYTIAPAQITSESLDVVLDTNSFKFTGDEFTPNIESITLNGQTLGPENFTVSYANNVNAGTKAAVIITAKGDNVEGSKTVYFTIEPRNLEEVLTEPGAVKIGNLDYVDEHGNPIDLEFIYTGSQITPNVEIKLGEDPLVEGRDYKLTYSSNLNAGTTGELLIEGLTDSLPDSQTVTFYIAPAKIDGSGVKIGEFDKSLKEPDLNLSYNGKPLVRDVDYELTYTNNLHAGDTATITITGKGNFANSADTVTFVIAQALIKDATIFIENTTFTYDGTAKEPEFVLQENGQTLVSPTDFTFEYINNVNAGTGIIRVTGKGDFAGVRDFEFPIQPIDISGATIIIDQAGAIDDNTFVINGSAVEPGITVIFDGSLFDPQNYIVSYTNNTKHGAAMVTIEGKGNYGLGNYSGKVDAPFVIRKVPEIIEGHGQSWVTESPNHAVFKSDAPINEFISVMVDGVELTHLEHYTLEPGSTVVSLTPQFLSTLPLGQHTIDVQSKTGTARGAFAVTEKPAPVVSDSKPSTSKPGSAKPNNSQTSGNITQANYRPSAVTSNYYISSNTKNEAVGTDETATGLSFGENTADAMGSTPMDDIASGAYSATNSNKTSGQSSSYNASTISPVWPWILVALGVAALLFLFIILARRKKQEEEETA